MRVLYGCYSGVHLSLIAAGLHLGWFNSKSNFSICRNKLKMYGSLTCREIGEPIFWGFDEKGREIYTIGLSLETQVFINAVKSLFGLYNHNGHNYHLIDTTPIGGKLTIMGSKLATLPLLRTWGESIIARSIAGNFSKLPRLVEETKLYLESYEQ